MSLTSERNRSHQKGFTLIEVIAVFVLLGIMSAIAVPQFVGLKTEAENKAAMRAVSEGRNRLVQQYAISIMNGRAVTNLTDFVSTVNADAGDYRLSFSVAGSEVNIEAEGVQEKGISGRASGKWKLPS